SGVGLTLQGIAAPAHVLVISPSATSPLLTSGEPAVDRYFFRTVGVVRHGEALAMVLFSGRPPPGAPAGAPPLCKRAYVVEDAGAVPEGYRDAFTEVFQKLGGCVVGHTTIPGEVASSYADTIALIRAARPDCTLVVALQTTLALLREAKPAFASDVEL